MTRQSTPTMHHSPTRISPPPFTPTTTPAPTSNRSKRAFESVSANDNLGSVNPPASSASSARKSKRSRNSSNKAAAGSTDSTTIALHAVDSSIRHLSDSLSANFVDPLKALTDAVTTTQRLTAMNLVPQAHEDAFLAVIEQRPAVAVIFNALENDEKRAGRIAKVFADEMAKQGQKSL